MRWLVLLLSMLSIPAEGLSAAELTGAATPIGPSFCRAATAEAPLRCPGPAGIDAYLRVGDAQTLVSLGSDKAGFVGIGTTSSLGATMEWRLSEGRPIAGIVRYRLPGEAGGESVGDVLAIVKVAEGDRPGCLVALVDLTVNPDGRAMSRRVADETSAGFACGADEARFVGVSSDWARALVISDQP